MIVTMSCAHALPAARLHAAALAGDFLPSLGIPFLTVFYRTAIEHGLGFGFMDFESEQPVGFVFASADTSVLFRRVVRRAAFPLGWAALPAVLRHPSLLLKVAETFLYPRREAAVAETAELLVIAVDNRKRSQGIGQTLVDELNRAFVKMGVRSYKVTVLQANTGANRFYSRNGFELAGSFHLYQRGWNIYLYSMTGETV
jgi:ribosomal protein S18 acetylase RimI-like enzyme